MTVLLPQVSIQIKEKYALATSQGLSHVVCVPGVKKESIDALVNDLSMERRETTDVESSWDSGKNAVIADLSNDFSNISVFTSSSPCPSKPAVRKIVTAQKKEDDTKQAAEA